ncbi:MAG: hypothetical protein EA350_17240 [Gemmatimonadales bacterium]|nr:MAG: hypothetical protein EA350_17240 [Gemmatimonadales bacterium]
MSDQPRIDVGLNAVIVAVTDERPRVLTLRGPDPADPEGRAADLLPYGPLDPGGDRTLELTLRGWVRNQARLELGYVEQLYTFGDRGRLKGQPLEGERLGAEPSGAWPRETRPPEAQPPEGEPRTLSVAYLALARERASRTPAGVHWQEVYAYLPWEDGRKGRPELFDRFLVPRLETWIRSAGSRRERDERRDRAAVGFGLFGSDWDGDRVLERYELLYGAGLVPEAGRDRGITSDAGDLVPGRPMGADHRRMLATALGRIRGKIRYRPVVFELVPPHFTLLQLQRVVEALSGVRLHKQNFRRLVERGGLVEGTGDYESDTGGRPAELFRFRREVLRERRAPGVGLPGA